MVGHGPLQERVDALNRFLPALKPTGTGAAKGGYELSARGAQQKQRAATQKGGLRGKREAAVVCEVLHGAHYNRKIRIAARGLSSESRSPSAVRGDGGPTMARCLRAGDAATSIATRRPRNPRARSPRNRRRARSQADKTR